MSGPSSQGPGAASISSLCRLIVRTSMPIERLWAVMHLYVTHNRYDPTQKQFAGVILQFFRETIPREWKKFRDTVSDNFRIITRGNVRVLA